MNPVLTLSDWIEDRKIASKLKVTSLALSETDLWNIGDDIIEHDTKRFFSIVGVKSKFRSDGRTFIDQPIINQPEIGILGFILAEVNGEIEILLHSKAEPGNIGGTQIAPTVQATYSNYMRVHQGKPTQYLEYFLKDGELVVEGSLQSEQGTRFLGKYNRNVTVLTSGRDIPTVCGDNWLWSPVKDLFSLMDVDYLVNTDARSVLVCADWNYFSHQRSPFENHKGKGGFGEKLYQSWRSRDEDAFQSKDELIDRLAESRKRFAFDLEICSLNDLDECSRDKFEIVRNDDFAIRSFAVSVEGREVPFWSQPLIHSKSEGKVILYCKEINGLLHFLVSHSCEVGFAEFVQFGPSIQILDQKNSTTFTEFEDKDLQIIGKYKQSDEGSRFYQSITEYSIVEINPEVTVESGNWMTLRQIYELLANKGNFNNEFRSVLSILLKFIC